MQIETFKVEQWMNEYEDEAKYNIAETCVDSISLDELFGITGEDKDKVLAEICARRLTYGDIVGSPAYRQGVCGLYRQLKPANIISTHGAIGANHLVMYALVEPGDKVISVLPTYQQHYSIPEGFGAEVKILRLRREQSYLPDLGELRQLAAGGAKLININNPNNPTGALMPESMLREIVEIARSAGAYLLCDEVYRGLNQEDEYTPSIADLYEKGISVGSMSKVFSLAGLRIGWLATPCQDVIVKCLEHRDYNMISCGILDEFFAGLALRHADKLLARNKKIVRDNLAILDQWVESQPHVSYFKPQAGTTALLHYDLPILSRDFCVGLLEKTGVMLTPGSCFELEHCLRIGYASDTLVLQDGLAKLGEYIQGIV